MSADFSRLLDHLHRNLVEHAERDGLSEVRKAAFLARGGHAPGERCPSAPADDPDPHEYWCATPESECNCLVGKSEMITSRQNDAGAWVPAIPLPYYGLRKRCDCGRRFWTMAGYRGHYALAHILESDQ